MEEKEMLHELEEELQEMNTKKQEPLVDEKPAVEVEDHHTKKHIGIIMLLVVLLVAILVIIAVVFRPSQEPEDVLRRLEGVSEPVTLTQEQIADITLQAEKESATPPLSENPQVRAQELDAYQKQLEALGSR